VRLKLERAMYDIRTWLPAVKLRSPKMTGGILGEGEGNIT
jgi:hypothetical protein